MARTLVAGPDAFAGTSGNAVSVYSANWQEQNGSTGELEIKDSTGGATGDSFRNEFGGHSDCSWKGAGSFTADQYAKITLRGTWSGADSDVIGIVLRSNGGTFGSNSCYRVLWGPSVGGSANAFVMKVTNGNNSNNGTQIGTNISLAMSAGDTLEGEAIDNGANVDIIVYKNGVSQGTRTDTASVFSTGKPGISGKNSANALFGDDWEGGNVGAAGAAYNAVPLLDDYYRRLRRGIFH